MFDEDMTNTERTYKVLGTTEDFDACQCCGRPDLKVYVVLENLQTGEIVHMGTTCAAKAEKVTSKVITEEVKAAELAAAEARSAAFRAETDRFIAWADENGGVRALGGFAAANAAFAEAVAA